MAYGRRSGHTAALSGEYTLQSHKIEWILAPFDWRCSIHPFRIATHSPHILVVIQPTLIGNGAVNMNFGKTTIPLCSPHKSCRILLFQCIRDFRTQRHHRSAPSSAHENGENEWVITIRDPVVGASGYGMGYILTILICYSGTTSVIPTINK